MFGEEYSDTGKATIQPTATERKKQPEKKRAMRPSVLTSMASNRNVLVTDSSDNDSEVMDTNNTERIRLKSVEDIVRELDEQENLGGAKAGCCARLFIPFIVFGLIVVILLATVFTSGGSADVSPVPRVAVVVLEGFTGPAFHAMMETDGPPPLPNIAAMLEERGGAWARCPTASATTCARAATTPEGTVSTGSGLTSILSGVPPRLHQVLNTTLKSMAAYMTTAASYPSLARRVKGAAKGVVAFGSASLLNGIGTTTGVCSQPGVLDIECATTADTADSDVVAATGGMTLDCFATTTCNVDDRLARVPTNPAYLTDGSAEARFTRQLRSVFGGLAYLTSTQETALQNTVADNLNDSLFIFHFDQLRVRADSASLPGFEYDANSSAYTGQAYLLDALVGQVTAYLRDRARSQKENWLVIGVSDHGGSGKSSAHGDKTDTAIPFFLGTYTSSTKGYAKLRPLAQTASQLDVLPTALRWLDIAPFDNATQAVVDGTNTTYSASVAAQVAARKVFEGKVQGICSSGVYATDCASA